ncbi:hypothetical protein AVEN_86300-1 [Araneus ventricosus]|uniref:Mos1 transposase HTH domain-containing protein n=1 Tax=Araneus ventricosus TaxID=182803 RepID=A0A4Y2H571_ARAVE|nr:hypothetical protein AVEN_86300-1 [Araneus ventricosus]
MNEVYGEQSLARCTIYRWCQRYEAVRVNIKGLPHSGLHVVTNSATVSAVDELIQKMNCASHNPQEAWLWQSSCTVGAQASVRESEDGENGCLPDPGVSTLKPSTLFLRVGISGTINL